MAERIQALQEPLLAVCGNALEKLKRNVTLPVVDEGTRLVCTRVSGCWVFSLGCCARKEVSFPLRCVGGKGTRLVWSGASGCCAFLRWFLPVEGVSFSAPVV